MNKKGFFSIELNSKNYLEKMDISNKPHEGVLVEGFLGEFTEIKHIEDSILKFEGVNGVLRLDIYENEFSPLFKLEKNGES